LHWEIEYLNLAMANDVIVAMEVERILETELREGQLEDLKLKEIWQLIRDNKTSDFSKDSLPSPVALHHHFHHERTIVGPLWSSPGPTNASLTTVQAPASSSASEPPPCTSTVACHR
jgi:hypothetical protein